MRKGLNSIHFCFQGGSSRSDRRELLSGIVIAAFRVQRRFQSRTHLQLYTLTSRPLPNRLFLISDFLEVIHHDIFLHFSSRSDRMPRLLKSTTGQVIFASRLSGTYGFGGGEAGGKFSSHYLYAVLFGAERVLHPGYRRLFRRSNCLDLQLDRLAPLPCAHLL